MFKHSSMLDRGIVGEYRGLAYDNECYYLLSICGTRVMKLDSSCSKVDCYILDTEYTCLCYDSISCSFWGATNARCDQLIKLDCRMRVSGKLLFDNKLMAGKIYSIAHINCTDSVIVGYARGSLLVVKSSAASRVINRNNCNTMSCVSSICPNMLAVYDSDTIQYFAVINECGRQIALQKSGVSGRVLAVVYDAVASIVDNENMFCMLICDKNRYYIASLTLQLGNIELCSCIKGIIAPCKGLECGCADTDNICTCDVDGGNL